MALIDQNLLMIGLVFGAVAIGVLKGTTRQNIPLVEIYLKKGAVAWIMTQSKEVIPYTIKPRGKYFVIYSNKIKGIFKIDPNHMWFMGKTPCYFYNIGNMNPIDPILLNELNHFCDKNKLTKIKRKDVRTSRSLRLWSKKHKDEKQTIEKASLELQSEMNEGIIEAQNDLDNQLNELNKESDNETTLTPKQTSIYILEYLEKKELLPKKEKDAFLFRVENELISFEELIEELQDNNVISISEPMDMTVERMLEDFGAQDPQNLAGHVDDLRLEKKGLKSLTSTPVKAFLPAAVIMAIGLVIVMAIAIIPGQLDTIKAALPDLSIPGFP